MRPAQVRGRDMRPVSVEDRRDDPMHWTDWRRRVLRSPQTEMIDWLWWAKWTLSQPLVGVCAYLIYRLMGVVK